MVVTIQPGAQPITIINAHVCRPAHQQTLAQALTDAVHNTYRHVPGFISASILRSDDGTRVTNYAQYVSAEAAHGVRSNPDVPALLAKVNTLAERFDFHLYEVREVISAAGTPVGITAGTPLATVVDVYASEPNQQWALADALAEAVQTGYRHEQGFVSGAIHLSQDGTRVAHYWQWQTHEAVHALRDSAPLAPHRQRVQALAIGFDGGYLYEVVSSVTS